MSTRIISQDPKFNRIFRFTIGTGANTVTIEDLGENPRAKRISFNITSVLQSYTQGATFQIYNLAPDTISNILTIKSPVVFQAGYRTIHEDLPPVIYNGNIQYGNSVRVGPDIVTTLTCHAYRDSLGTAFPVSYEAGIAVTTILQEIQGDIKDPQGNTLPLQIIDGTSLGNIADDFTSATMSKLQVLDYLAMNHSFNWWADTVTKQLIIVPVGRALREDEILLINSKTGLIGSPEISANGITFRTLLEPDIRYMSVIQVEYARAVGQFIIGEPINKLRELKTAKITAVTVSHTGDTRGDEWTTECTGNWFPSLLEYI